MKFENIENEMKNNGWDSQPDKLFLELLKEITNKEECIGKEFEIKYIVSILDEVRNSKKINIKNDKSYNMAKKVMLSNRNGRDYFIFKNEQVQDKLTEIVKGNTSGFEWSNYCYEHVMINPKYINVVYAGKNEKDFESIFETYKLNGLLKGKKTYNNKKSGDEKVSISVDYRIVYDNKEILIEIDSGNMAKLIVGQYTLLNILCENPENKTFIVVHYYKDYNPIRTIKNLKFVADKLFGTK